MTRIAVFLLTLCALLGLFARADDHDPPQHTSSRETGASDADAALSQLLNDFPSVCPEGSNETKKLPDGRIISCRELSQLFHENIEEKGLTDKKCPGIGKDCMNQVLCNGLAGIESVAGLFTMGLSNHLPDSLFSPVCPGGFGKQGNCLTSLVGGIIKGFWGNIEGIFGMFRLASQGLKAAGAWAWKTFKQWTGLEAESSKAMHAAMGVSPDEVAQYNQEYAQNPLKAVVDFVYTQAMNIVQGLNEYMITSFFCEEWDGIPHAPGSTCKKPTTEWRCAHCGQWLNAACGVLGIIAGETAFGVGLTSGLGFASIPARLGGAKMMQMARAAEKAMKLETVAPLSRLAMGTGRTLSRLGKGLSAVAHWLNKPIEKVAKPVAAWTGAARYLELLEKALQKSWLKGEMAGLKVSQKVAGEAFVSGVLGEATMARLAPGIAATGIEAERLGLAKQLSATEEGIARLKEQIALRKNPTPSSREARRLADLERTKTGLEDTLTQSNALHSTRPNKTIVDLQNEQASLLGERARLRASGKAQAGELEALEEKIDGVNRRLTQERAAWVFADPLEAGAPVERAQRLVDKEMEAARFYEKKRVSGLSDAEENAFMSLKAEILAERKTMGPVGQAAELEKRLDDLRQERMVAKRDLPPASATGEAAEAARDRLAQVENAIADTTSNLSRARAEIPPAVGSEPLSQPRTGAQSERLAVSQEAPSGEPLNLERGSASSRAKKLRQELNDAENLRTEHQRRIEEAVALREKLKDKKFGLQRDLRALQEGPQSAKTAAKRARLDKKLDKARKDLLDAEQRLQTYREMAPGFEGRVQRLSRELPQLEESSLDASDGSSGARAEVPEPERESAPASVARRSTSDRPPTEPLIEGRGAALSKAKDLREDIKQAKWLRVEHQGKIDNAKILAAQLEYEKHQLRKKLAGLERNGESAETAEQVSQLNGRFREVQSRLAEAKDRLLFYERISRGNEDRIYRLTRQLHRLEAQLAR